MDALATFAENLKRARQRADLTQEELASRSGVDFASIGRIERGSRDPGVRTIARLAGGLDIDPAELFDGVPRAGGAS